MRTVTLHHLCDKGAEVLDRVADGEAFVVTRDGRAVAELSLLRRRGAPAPELIARRRALPPIDPGSPRRDLDELLGASL